MRFILFSVVLLSAVNAVSLQQLQSPSLCTCSQDLAADQLFELPAVGSSTPTPIRVVSNTSLCLVTAPNSPNHCDGTCLFVGPCSSTNTTVLFNAELLSDESGPVVLKSTNYPSLCMDFNMGHRYLQLYRCLKDSNQQWRYETGNGGLRLQENFDEAHQCLTLPGQCQLEFCPLYHTIQSPDLYDPSGPLQTDDKIWHMWEDLGGWSHYTSQDLINWTKTSPSTNFSGLTGSITHTQEGYFAFWPASSQEGILTAKASDAPTLNNWVPRPEVSIPAPEYTGKNFRDPVRGFEYQGKWYVGVGCNNMSNSADFCLFEASDATLSKFTDVGPLFSVNHTYGVRDSNLVWHNNSVKATMMECPDILPLGSDGRVMVIASLFSTNQWWTGKIQGQPPRFVPENVGLLDFGSFYAGKTGSRSPPFGSRHLLFAFSGWHNPTAKPECGRSILLPRDVSMLDGTAVPLFDPIPELENLRRDGQSWSTSQTNLTVGSGAQLELYFGCGINTSSTPTERVAFRVLASEGHYTEIGYDFVQGELYADHSYCCEKANNVRQVAPLPLSSLSKSPSGEVQLHATVFVDGGLIESFAGRQVVLTTMVNPAGSQANVTASFYNPGQLPCAVSSWKMAQVRKAQPP